MTFFKKKTHDVDFDNLPRHIGIIMDGNGRWAKKRGLPRSAGHAAGAETFKKITTYCGEIGIKYLTVYAELRGKNVRVRVIGERYMLSEKLLSEIEALENHTEKNMGLQLNLALSYGGRQEIVHAAKKCAERVKNGEISPEDITCDMMSSYMYTAGQDDPDLIIRPSGEKRTSNFLLWQSAYSEYWFSHVMWPSFKEKHLLEAIAEYQKRNRRFGAL